MSENRSLLKKVLSNQQYHSKSSSIRYMSPCEMLTEYLRDSCSIFSGDIVQTNGINGKPPIPVIPPNPIVPPNPPGPGPFFGTAQFISIAGLTIAPGEAYEFETLGIQGNAIQHIDGSTDIILAPNTAYEFFLRIESLTNVPAVVIIGGALVLDGVSIPNSEVLTPGLGTMPLVAEKIGEFITGDNESILRLVYASNVGQFVESDAILNISTI